ncbi:MAG: hypothetical protein KA782_05885, partial [Flavobacterium sp.]|nr:hypothetical protein [Flavobacterium sp.]
MKKNRFKTFYSKKNNYFSIPEQNSTLVMDEKNFAFSINHESDIPKYQQLVNSINNAIAENLLSKGDLLPSV